MKEVQKGLNLLFVALIFSLSIMTFSACSDDDAITSEEENEEEIDDTDFEATDWTEATHSKDADPDFDKVFEDNALKRLDIVITETRWQSILDDMTETSDAFGSGSGGPGLIDADEDPIFVSAEVFHEGI
jgi:hypothetical protein